MTVAALEILRPLEARYPLEVGDLLARLASLEAARGDETAARRLALEAWESVRKLPVACDWFTVLARVRVARTIAEQGLTAEALSLLQPSREIMRAQLGPDHSEVEGLVAELQERPTPAAGPSEE
jgi:hypothetical protein